MVSQWGVVLVLTLGLLNMSDALPFLSAVKSFSAPTATTVGQLKEDELESEIAYVDSPYDPADGQVALPTKVYGSLGAKKWVEDAAQRPIYKAPPYWAPTPKPRVVAPRVPNVNELKTAARSVNDTLYSFMSSLAAAKEGPKPPGNMVAKALGAVAAAEEANAKESTIDKLRVEANRRVAVQAAKSSNFVSQVLSAKANLSKTTVVLEEAMHTSNHSHILMQWLKDAEANHETDRVAILKNDIGEAGLRQAHTLAQAVKNEQLATASMFDLAKQALKGRPVNMSGAALVFSLTGKAMPGFNPRKNRAVKNATVAPVEDDEPEIDANVTNISHAPKKAVWASMPKPKKNGGFCKDGSDCNNHGTCRNGVCKCFKGWTYIDCSMRACKHGRWARSQPGAMCPTCEPTLMPLHCQCDKDWFGPTCSQKLCPGRIPGVKDERTQCNGNGNCVEGECDCDEAFRGNACQIHKCHRSGDYENGTCSCYPGFWGTDCAHKMCPASNRNETAGTLTLCAGNGHCSPAGVCMCQAGYELPGCCPTGCKTHGICTSQGCMCKPGYEGNACQLGPCLNGCSGHGICTGTKYSGSNITGCKCNADWTGIACDVPACPSKNGTYCAGNGECDMKTGICNCDDNHKGDDCSEYVCPGMCGNNGPDNATHGVCNSATGKCKCNEEWEGDMCDSRSCFRLSNCSGHGSCDNGNCSCDAGWAGEACQVPTVLACLNNCSNHGDCVMGKCSCTYGYRGKACNELKCFHGTRYKKACNSTKSATVVEDDMPTKLGMKQTCVCHNGWEGIHCNTTVDQPSALVNETVSADQSLQIAHDQLSAIPCPVSYIAPPAAETTRMAIIFAALKNFDLKTNRTEFEEALKTDLAMSLDVIKSKITVHSLMNGAGDSANDNAFIELAAVTPVSVDISFEGGDVFKVAAFPKGATFTNLGKTCGQPITPDSIIVHKMPAGMVDEDEKEEEKEEAVRKPPNLAGLFAVLGMNASVPTPPAAPLVEETEA